MTNASSRHAVPVYSVFNNLEIVEDHCEVTVKIHRGQAMRKMKARTFADLVLMAQQIGICKEQH